MLPAHINPTIRRDHKSDHVINLLEKTLDKDAEHFREETSDFQRFRDTRENATSLSISVPAESIATNRKYANNAKNVRPKVTGL